MNPAKRDFGFHTLAATLRQIAHREVDALCSVCLTRPEATAEPKPEAGPEPEPATGKPKLPASNPSAPPPRARRTSQNSNMVWPGVKWASR